MTISFELDFFLEKLVNKEIIVCRKGVVDKLSSLGCVFSQVENGWKLINQLTLFDRNFLKSHLKDHQFILKRITDSTNDDLWEVLAKDVSASYVVLTEYQFNGRGTRGRTWYSSLGGGICFSFNHCIKNYLEGEIVSLKVALAIVEFLEELGVKELSIKWPNDVFYQNKKIAGILTEARSFFPNQLVIGVGINWFISKNLESKIKQPTIDLQRILPNDIERDIFFVNLLFKIKSGLKQKNFLKKYQKYDFWWNKYVKLIWKGNEYEGIGHGIDNNGNFLLKTESNIIKCKPLSVNFL